MQHDNNALNRVNPTLEVIEITYADDALLREDCVSRRDKAGQITRAKLSPVKTHQWVKPY
jgi:hypothetical protein